MRETFEWEGASGKTYEYYVSPIEATFKDKPGNYLFAAKNAAGYWDLLYIGQTDSLSRRLDDHPEEQCVQRHGATHIHTHTTPESESARRREEADLLDNFDPPCND